MHLANTLPLSHTVLHTSSASRQPSPPPPHHPSHSIARSSKLPLPCGEYARALPFYLFLSCSINLSVQPDVGRASCIPNTKNNHFSVTGVGWGGGGVPERGVWVWGWVVGGYLQLTGIRFNCSNSTGEGVMGRRLKKSVVYFLQTLDRKYRVPATANAETHFLFHCWGKNWTNTFTHAPV